MATAVNFWIGSSGPQDWPASCPLDVETLDALETLETIETPIGPLLEETLTRQVSGSESGSKAHSLDAAESLSRRDRVVLEHLPLVKAIAVRVHENLPVHVDLDDLVHAGVLGLFDAATKFNPEKQVVFSSYAKHRIKGAILDSLRQLDWASRDLRRRHKQIEAATRELAAELQRTPTEVEVADRLGINMERWREMMLDMRSVGLISANTRSTEHDDLPMPEYPGAPETQPDNMCAREQLRAKLQGAMACLPDDTSRLSCSTTPTR